MRPTVDQRNAVWQPASIGHGRYECEQPTLTRIEQGNSGWIWTKCPTTTVHSGSEGTYMYQVGKRANHQQKNKKQKKVLYNDLDSVRATEELIGE